MGALKLAPLADATGGVILLLEDFGESFFENLSAAVRRPASDGAIFTVRASAGVGCARVIGAVEALSRAVATMATAPSLPSGDSAAPAEDAADAFRMKSRDISQVRHPICSASSVRSVSTPSQEPGALMCAHGPRVGRRLTSKHNQPATSLFLGGIGPNCVDTSRCVSPPRRGYKLTAPDCNGLRVKLPRDINAAFYRKPCVVLSVSSRFHCERHTRNDFALDTHVIHAHDTDTSHFPNIAERRGFSGVRRGRRGESRSSPVCGVVSIQRGWPRRAVHDQAAPCSSLQAGLSARGR